LNKTNIEKRFRIKKFILLAYEKSFIYICPIKTNTMNLQDAKNLAIELMDKHGLLDGRWHFEFDNAKNRFGCCNHTYKRISLSKNLVALNDEARVKNTILHEIAHALVGSKHGHDYVWRRKALEIGCDGNRCFSSRNTEIPESKYIAECSGCGKVHKRHKMTRSLKYGNSSCGNCSGGRYNEKFKLVWKENPNY
jgi:predicted SprT family Zn-dependent metalloprotease